MVLGAGKSLRHQQIPDRAEGALCVIDKAFLLCLLGTEGHRAPLGLFHKEPDDPSPTVVLPVGLVPMRRFQHIHLERRHQYSVHNACGSMQLLEDNDLVDDKISTKGI